MKLSSFPVYLALMVIGLFGMLPTLGYYVQKVRDLSRYQEEFLSKETATLKAQMVQEIHATFGYLDHLQSLDETRLETSLVAALDRVHKMVSRQYRQLAGKLSKQDLESMIRSMLRDLRFFDEKGYVFAFDLNGIQQVYPPDPAIEGMNWLELEDSEGEKFFKNAIEMVKARGAGFIRHAWPFPGQIDRDEPKISYLRLFTPFNWIIGIGDFPKTIQDRLLDTYLESLDHFNTDLWAAFIIDQRKGPEPSFFPATLRRPYQATILEAVDKIDKDLLQSSGGFARYDRLDEKDRPTPMLLFARSYPNWEMTLGLTVDLNQHMGRVNHEFEAYRKNLISDLWMAVLILLGAVFFAVITAGFFSFWLKRQLDLFDCFFHRAGEQDEQINLSRIKFKELKKIGKMANQMVSQREENLKTIEKANQDLKDANLRLQELAHVDGLTGIANRRHLDRIMAQEWDRAVREKTPLALGIIDVDRFKLYNDTFGHQKGDTCLTLVAKTLQSAVLRPADLVARYGGEEFAVFLPGTEARGAEQVGKRAQEALAAMNLPHPSTPLGRVSFSMGISSMTPGPETAFIDLINQADQALYLAKEKGRNQIQIYPS